MRRKLLPALSACGVDTSAGGQGRKSDRFQMRSTSLGLHSVRRALQFCVNYAVLFRQIFELRDNAEARRFLNTFTNIATMQNYWNNINNCPNGIGILVPQASQYARRGSAAAEVNGVRYLKIPPQRRPMSPQIKALTLAASLAFLASPALAERTHVMVRARAQDAKFIGDHMGGVQITLTDARTGAVLAKGLTKGGTGDTSRIMKTPMTRGVDITDPSTAGFNAVLDINQPTLVRVNAVGPVGKPSASIKVSSTQWILPGHDIVGDGWVLEFPGLVIEPTTVISPGAALQIRATISLMCGCPIEPGGIWNADRYKVEAHLMKGDRDVAATELTYAGQPSQFSGELAHAPAGRYRLRLVAADATTSNAGVIEVPVRLR